MFGISARTRHEEKQHLYDTEAGFVVNRSSQLVPALQGDSQDIINSFCQRKWHKYSTVSLYATIKMASVTPIGNAQVGCHRESRGKNVTSSRKQHQSWPLPVERRMVPVPCSSMIYSPSRIFIRFFKGWKQQVWGVHGSNINFRRRQAVPDMC